MDSYEQEKADLQQWELEQERLRKLRVDELEDLKEMIRQEAMLGDPED